MSLICPTVCAAAALAGIVIPVSQAKEGESLSLGQWQLAIAQAYEENGEFAKAEQHYLEAGQSAESDVRQQALEGLRRILSSRPHPLLEAGRFYEEQKLFDQAEKYYQQALAEENPEVRSQALEGIEQIQQSFARCWTFWEARLINYGSRILMLAAIALLVRVVLAFVLWCRRRRNGIELMPFQASGDEAASSRLHFWLAYVRSQLQAHARRSETLNRHSSSSPLRYVVLPSPISAGSPPLSLADALPDLGNVTFGGLKLPVRVLVAFLSRPRTRVSGGWMRSFGTGRAFAEIETRRVFRGYRQVESVSRPIPHDSPDRDLEVFAYEVFMKATASHRT